VAGDLYGKNLINLVCIIFMLPKSLAWRLKLQHWDVY
jgi:hypothetical protein